MEIYGALLIPIIFGLVSIFIFKKKITWWEPILTLGVCLILIVISKISIEKMLISDTEYWGSLTKEVRYEEDWDEYIHQTCTRTVSCGKDCTTTEIYDCSYVDYHPPKWYIITKDDGIITISKNEYLRIKNKFNNEQFKDLRRSYHSNDGDMYYSLWGGEIHTSEPVTTAHRYDNKTQVASSVFNYEELNKEEIEQYQLYDYSKITENHTQIPILGIDDSISNHLLDYYNGLLGRDKQLRIWILIFNDQPIEAGMKQEIYWKGGNKNEFVITLGLDGDKIKWSHVFSWSEVETSKIKVRNFIMDQERLDLSNTINYVKDELQTNFVRKEFKDFDYLKIDPPFWSIILVYGVTIILSLIITIWSIKNNY